MTRFTALVALISVSVATAQLCSLGFQDLCDAQSAFGSGNISTSLIGGNGTFEPMGILGASYPSLSSVAMAQQLDPARVSSPPVMTLNTTDKKNFYNRGVLLLVDPDVSNATNLHWMVTDVALDYASNLLVNGTAVAPYAPPMPPSGDSPHRYIFLLYNQFNNFTLPAAYQGLNGTNATTITAARRGFDPVAFANSTGLGLPLAGLYFKSAYNTGGAQTTTSAGTVEAITMNAATMFSTGMVARDMEARQTPEPTNGVARFERRKRN